MPTLPFNMGLRSYALLSFGALMATSTVMLAQYPNYYSAMVAMATEFVALAVLANMAVVTLVLFGKLVIYLFLGKLRDAELQTIYQRLCFLVLDGIYFASNVVLNQRMLEFATMSLYVAFLMIFHWISEERVEFLYQMMEMPRMSAQIRLAALIGILTLADVALCLYAWKQFLLGNRIVVYFFRYYSVLLQMTLAMVVRFLVKGYEAHRYRRREDVDEDDEWEPKETIFFVTDFVLNMFSLGMHMFVLYLLGFTSLHTIYGLAERVVRLYSATRDYIKARTAKAELDKYVTAATEEDLSRDNVCVICREEMELAPASDRNLPKRMVCEHVIHYGCLKSWLGRHQNCPTCRQPVKAAHSAFNRPTQTQIVSGPARTATTEPARVPASLPAENAPSEASTGATRLQAALQEIDTRSWHQYATRVGDNGNEIKLGGSWYRFEVE